MPPKRVQTPSRRTSGVGAATPAGTIISTPNISTTSVTRQVVIGAETSQDWKSSSVSLVDKFYSNVKLSRSSDNSDESYEMAESEQHFKYLHPPSFVRPRILIVSIDDIEPGSFAAKLFIGATDADHNQVASTLAFQARFKNETRESLLQPKMLPAWRMNVMNSIEDADCYKENDLPGIRYFQECKNEQGVKIPEHFFVRQLLKGKFKSDFHLRSYPFDKQVLQISFSLDCPNSIATFDKKWLNSNGARQICVDSSNISALKNLEWDIDGDDIFFKLVNHYDAHHGAYHGIDDNKERMFEVKKTRYSILTVVIPVTRITAHYAFVIFLPLMLIILSSFFVFVELDCPENEIEYGDSITFLATLLLAVFAMKFTFASLTPRLSYLTTLDKVFVWSYLYIFGCLVALFYKRNDSFSSAVTKTFELEILSRYFSYCKNLHLRIALQKVVRTILFVALLPINVSIAKKYFFIWNRNYTKYWIYFIALYLIVAFEVYVGMGNYSLFMLAYAALFYSEAKGTLHALTNWTGKNQVVNGVKITLGSLASWFGNFEILLWHIITIYELSTSANIFGKLENSAATDCSEHDEKSLSERAMHSFFPNAIIYALCGLFRTDFFFENSYDLILVWWSKPADESLLAKAKNILENLNRCFGEIAFACTVIFLIEENTSTVQNNILSPTYKWLQNRDNDVVTIITGVLSGILIILAVWNTDNYSKKTKEKRKNTFLTTSSVVHALIVSVGLFSIFLLNYFVTSRVVYAPLLAVIVSLWHIAYDCIQHRNYFDKALQRLRAYDEEKDIFDDF